MIKNNENIPEPSEEKYKSFTSSYGNEIHYMKVTVNISL